MTQFTQDDISKLGSIMSIWAHPDDESYSCAGIMCVARNQGQQVVCVTATRGEAGVQDEKRWPADQLGDIREREMAEALKIIGVEDHHWLGYADGKLPEVPPAEGVARLKELIDHHQPDTILTFGPEGMTGHPDHCTISTWVSEATQGTQVAVYHAVQILSHYQHFKEADDQFDIFFNIDKPPLVEEHEADVLFDLPEGCIQKKYQALKAMPSQTEAMFTTVGKEAICRMIRIEAFVRAELSD